MKTNYPLRLERHDNPFFTLSDVSSFSQGFAYYHGADYPILMHSHNSISFIAQECGFFDSSHFTHAFEQATNMNPKEFRRKSHIPYERK